MSTDKLTTLFGILSGIVGGIAVLVPDSAVVAGPLFAVFQALKGFYTNKK